VISLPVKSAGTAPGDGRLDTVTSGHVTPVTETHKQSDCSSRSARVMTGLAQLRWDFLREEGTSKRGVPV